ncbi:hypothetical protein HIM_08249 [Hirsutella minnesotensis 3608]|uniref:Uncharacterized protein n=1 Tax=Hirsutella minnesotensis 3608 TaxID=1043627 RepID=A0A0F7ZT15_9HYPO|nr:hypothetical protein HIM_08249 [Hirsutella minnesotensis 3608]
MKSLVGKASSVAGSLGLRVGLLIPLILTLLSAILSTVLLASGTSPGMLENAAVFKLDISRLDLANGLRPESPYSNRGGRNGAGFGPGDRFGNDRFGNDDRFGRDGGRSGRNPLDFFRKRDAVDDLVNGQTPDQASNNGKNSGSTPHFGDLLASSGGGSNNTLGAALGSAVGSQGGRLISGLLGQGLDGFGSAYGLPQWFSLHPRTLCNGDFIDGPGSFGSVRVRTCTIPGRSLQNLGELISMDGTYQNFQNIYMYQLPKVVNEMNRLTLDTINTSMTLLTVALVLSAIFTFLAAIVNLIALASPKKGIVVVINFLLAGLAWLIVAITYIASFAVTNNFVQRINVMFEDFQVVSQLGPQFLGMGVTALIFSTLSALIWTAVFFLQFRSTLVSLFKILFTRAPAPAKHAEDQI